MAPDSTRRVSTISTWEPPTFATRYFLRLLRDFLEKYFSTTRGANIQFLYVPRFEGHKNGGQNICAERESGGSNSGRDVLKQTSRDARRRHIAPESHLDMELTALTGINNP